MNGIELSEKFYLEYGKSMLEEKFPHLLPYIAVGISGSGSDSFGYDDEISRDHDYEAGFCVFLPGEDLVSRRDEFLLERAYSSLPKEFMGVKRNILDPVGGNRKGIIRFSDFFTQKTGAPDGNLTTAQWLELDEFYLAEATNGKVFFDGLGAFSAIREKLLNMPEDVRLKKIAGNLLTAAQSGLYNYPRCVLRGEKAAAQLALFEFVKSVLSVIFTFNKKYAPYYKWIFKAYKALDKLNGFSAELEYLLSSPNDKTAFDKKTAIVNAVLDDVCAALNQTYSLSEKDPGKLAYLLNDLIVDPSLRNENLFIGAK